MNSIQQFFLQKQFNNKKRQEFLIQLSFLLKAGVPATDALTHMAKIYQENKNILLQTVANLMLQNIKEGKKIGENLFEWFPYEVCRVLSLAEERGFLLQGIQNLISYFKSGQSAFKTLLGLIPGLSYFIVILVFIAFTGTKLLPSLGDLVKTWPTISIALNKTGVFIYYNYYFAVAIIILLTIWVIKSLQNYTGKITQIAAKPLLSSYKLHISLLLFKSLSMLTENGVAVSDAIKTLLLNRKSGFLYHNLTAMYDRVRLGENVGNVLDTGIFTKDQISHLKIISQYCSESEFAKIFAIMGEQASYELNKKMKIISKLANFIFLILTVLGVLWVYGAYALLISSIT